jgi:hypothetical protein
MAIRKIVARSIGVDVIVAEDIAANAITAAEISSGAVTTAKLATDLVVTHGLGSASTPSITFTGDTNTGIFSPTADTIAFAEGGAEIARFDSSGNFGIGTTSPTSQLQLNRSGTSDYTTFRLSNSGASGRTYEIGLGGNTAASGYANSLYFYDSGAGSIRMAVDSSGRVTIPFQPAFMAGAASGSQTITTGTSNVVQLNATKYNVGSHYNTSTYTFTAPVAGLYAFKMYTTIITSTNNAITGGSDFQCKLYINGADYCISGSNGDYGGNPVGYFASSTRLAFAVLAAGDTATSNIFQSTGSSQTLQLAMCNFSGYLVR